ncbi:Flagellar P-ring protein flgI [gamma proteobacterium IMCC1989]|nr:Flagellar P-ring protein flgI [gamma proteobacterium IMCC1989]
MAFLMNRLHIIIANMLLLLFIFAQPVIASTVKVKELTRLSGTKDNALVGYGIITGLAGTGDSSRSKATFQSIKNILKRFGIDVPVANVHSRNAAAVMVTTTLSPFSQVGDKLDINVTSMGDARNLVGGTLLMTHLTGADQNIYALAQGPLSVGGFSYDFNGNLVQKNHPTAGYISGGAIVERQVDLSSIGSNGYIAFSLQDPNFSTAFRIAESINIRFNETIAKAQTASQVVIRIPQTYENNLVSLIMSVQEISVSPDIPARVVVNERTGTVVSGGDVRVSSITITHGDLNVSIKSDFSTSQPLIIGQASNNVKTETLQQSEIEVSEDAPFNVSLPDNITVSTLVSALNKVKASSRDVITILQSIKRAGALHAELVIQ